MDIKSLCNLIDDRKDELFDLLCRLIRINSENFGPHGNEEECAHYIDNLCRELGLESDMYSPISLDGFSEGPDYFPGRNLENRYNVSARWRGMEDVDALMLMGHIDTVEIGAPSNWEFPPLSGEVRDGKVFGRGACDDKYALATALFLIKLLKEQGFVPKQNIVFSAYCDEELGGSHGAMASVMKYPCKTVLNMDGRENQIWHCASGGQVVIYRYHSINAADSSEKTAMAFPIVMAEVKKFAERRSIELEENRFYKGTIIPSTSLRYNEIRAGNNGLDMGVGHVQFTFYTDKTKEEIYEEFREIEEILNEKLEPLGFIGDGFVPHTRYFHYGFCEPDNPDIVALVDAAKEATGRDLIVCGSCLSDLSVLLKYGSRNAFAFGAGRDFSKIGGAHQPNEFIECDELVIYAKNIAAYILKLLG